jgi:leucyl aminopeptidase
MLDQTLGCLVRDAAATRPLYVIGPHELAGFLDGLPPAQASFVRESGFVAAAQELVLLPGLGLPGQGGVAGAVLGLGEDQSPYAFGNLAFRLPDAVPWRLELAEAAHEAAVLGFCLGAYRFGGLKQAADRKPAQLLVPTQPGRAEAEAAAIWMVRDLINTPANLLGPVELADCVAALGRRYDAAVTMHEGAVLDAAYPTVAAVGRGSARPPRVACLQWAGSTAPADAPLLSLCGKGVCFDTGGYDLKSSAGMLRMKKDMGGGATMMGLARLVMEADLPVRLVLRVGCVENSVSGTAMRPLDVIRTRSGRTVEVGNTDAEGRLVLCDLLDDACAEAPALLIDAATLTGAARVALGPDLPALFCNDDVLAESLLRAGQARHDPMWRLPLWAGYGSWLNSPVADLNNVSGKPHAGAIVAALFLQRFVTAGTKWAHFDIYAWNDQTRPGRPEGGEAQTIRALFTAIYERMVDPGRAGCLMPT